ncbi:MAG: sigma-54-dependent Fis family transcriptional regulator [Bacteroides sp.]|nr:sigma-54-dependent Fis family transcriptional regulator [Bacteroides sp.]
MNKKAESILIVDDNRGVLTALQLLLKPYFKEIRTLSSPVTLLTTLRKTSWNLLLLDMNFTSGINTGNEGLYWLHEVKRIAPDLPVVLFTAYADIDLAVRGMKEGACDFIVKPWDNNKMVETLLHAAQSKQSNKCQPTSSDTTDSNSGMYWGESRAMQQLHFLVEKVAATDTNILITGENGTGKEMLARELHRHSLRCNKPLVSVDMGAITESLFESELFGHAKGAFTDAHTDRIGKFEAAHQSTLFLDEIGNLPYHQQAKLLTALQQRSIVRVGSNTPIPIDIRLICATNRNLQEMVNKGEFREDLLYRINTIHLELPSLRQRSEDILPLANRFIEQSCRKYRKPALQLSDEACQKLLRHTWPGNIRELQHTIEKGVIICEDTTLSASLFHLTPTKETAPKPASTLEEMERQMIQQTLEACNGNLSAVASQLGITRQTLYNKLKKYGI